MKENSINAWLDTVVARYGPKIAITFLRNGRTGTELSYAQLQRDIHRFANILLDRGVQKGDRVVLFIPKSLIAVIAHFAIQAVGAMAVPLNPGFKKNEMAYLLGDADARLIIVDADKETLIRDIVPDSQLLAFDDATPYQELDFFFSLPETRPAIDIAANDPGLVIYTSGTTGKPKGAVLSHGNLVADARNIIDIWEITDADVLCHALPLFSCSRAVFCVAYGPSQRRPRPHAGSVRRGYHGGGAVTPDR